MKELEYLLLSLHCAKGDDDVKLIRQLTTAIRTAAGKVRRHAFWYAKEYAKEFQLS